MVQRLVSFWVYGGALAAVLLLALAPALLAGRPLAQVAVFLHLPAYMLHQYEEHDHDRFRRFVNMHIGRGHEVLTPLAVFIINVPVVWGLLTLAFHAAATQHLGWALAATYLMLVNALVHIVHAVVLRRYNPGLATAVLVFVPLGGTTLWLIQHAGAGSLAHHAAGLAIAVALHAAILAHAMRRLAALQGGKAAR